MVVAFFVAISAYNDNPFACKAAKSRWRKRQRIGNHFHIVQIIPGLSVTLRQHDKAVQLLEFSQQGVHPELRKDVLNKVAVLSLKIPEMSSVDVYLTDFPATILNGVQEVYLSCIPDWDCA